MSLVVSDRVRSTIQPRSLEKHLVDQSQRHQRIMPAPCPRTNGQVTDCVDGFGHPHARRGLVLLASANSAYCVRLRRDLVRAGDDHIWRDEILGAIQDLSPTGDLGSFLFCNAYGMTGLSELDSNTVIGRGSVTENFKGMHIGESSGLPRAVLASLAASGANVIH